MNSMTGFGRADAQIDGAGFVVEVNSLNRRNLEVVVTLPKDWQSLEKPLVDEVRSVLKRGRVAISVQAQDLAETPDVRIDEASLSASLKTLRAFAAREGINFDPGPELIFQIAWQHRVGRALPDAEASRDSLLASCRKALEELVSMRRSEGAVLALDLQERIGNTLKCIEEIRTHSKGTVERHRNQLLHRLRQSELDLDLEDDRVLREIALFADRCDISEELTRLESHIEQFRSCIREEGSIGRKLEFLLQEIGRELNTTGSKANNLEISRRVVDAKSELERIREQVQNIE